MQITIFIISAFIIAGFLLIIFRKKKQLTQPDANAEKEILSRHVLFYQRLPDLEKIRFEESLKKFLQKIRITGIKTTVEDIDRVFVAAAAIIPIFAFKDWEYRNIHEVLLYPGSFNEEYHLEGGGRNVSGMVGTGALQNVMLLSQNDLRSGFLNHTDTSNTAIHEFVHLVDKTDGSTDGIPEILLAHSYILPWLKCIHEEIQQIQNGQSDINPYGSTNEAEFLAVASEYFFEKPSLMQEKHPQLFDLLQKCFTAGAN
ncbi:MAG: zinc-dependent peptidase [Chitinophagaceae bacterium]|nr:zinc-dependent peptidase [Chitinophagaceae bacterium]